MRKLTKDELSYFRKHPELIEAFGDKVKIYHLVLVILFIVGLILVVVSKVIKHAVGVDSYSLWVELTVDLSFELGVALWCGVAATVLLNDYMKRQYNEGRRYQQEIIRQLEEEDKRSTETTIVSEVD